MCNSYLGISGRFRQGTKSSLGANQTIIAHDGRQQVRSLRNASVCQILRHNDQKTKHVISRLDIGTTSNIRWLRNEYESWIKVSSA